MQGFLSTVAIQQNTYVPANRVVNLGYLPGGSVGLQTLAKDPASAIPLTADLQPAWQSGLLQNITKISDFGALIVITENADTARYWIEQVQPALGSTPLIVVISAQSAPMLQPYFSSGQVQGYLAGLNAATIYEELSQQPGVATINFSAFQYAMLVVTLIVFIGGVLSLVLTRPAGEGDRVSQK